MDPLDRVTKEIAEACAEFLDTVLGADCPSELRLLCTRAWLEGHGQGVRDAAKAFDRATGALTRTLDQL